MGDMYLRRERYLKEAVQVRDSDLVDTGRIQWNRSIKEIQTVA